MQKYARTGLNQGCLVSELKIATASSGRPYLNGRIQCGTDSRPIFWSIFPVDEVPVFKGGKIIDRITDPAHEQFKQAQNDFKAVVFDLMTAFGVNDPKGKVEAERPKNAEEFLQVCLDFIPQDYPLTPIDVFLEYDKGSDGKFYRKVAKEGAGPIFYKNTGVEWKEVVDLNGLRYEYGKLTHPFIREPWYLKTKRWLGDPEQRAAFKSQYARPAEPQEPTTSFTPDNDDIPF